MLLPNETMSWQATFNKFGTDLSESVHNLLLKTTTKSHHTTVNDKNLCHILTLLGKQK